jgi:hypothetical protein
VATLLRLGAALTVLAVLCAPAFAGETRALVIAGLGGAPEYEETFARHAGTLRDKLADVTEDVTLLAGTAATADAVEAALTALAGRLTRQDSLLLVYVGHGSWDDERFRFNVPGPDFTGADLAGWLDAVNAAHQIVIATGASSGALQDILAADGRTVITATRSGEQRNATVFADYFTAALDDTAADVDKDGRVTVLEAFEYTRAGVERHYDRAGEMTVENPVTSGPEPVLVLARLDSDAPTAAGSADAALLARRDELELDIASLKARRDDYQTAEYFEVLKALLLEMATIEAQLAEGEGDNP